MPMDTAWALKEIDQFLQFTALGKGWSEGLSREREFRSGSPENIIASATVVEQIFDRVLPYWRTSVPEQNYCFDRWDRHPAPPELVPGGGAGELACKPDPVHRVPCGVPADGHPSRPAVTGRL